MRVGASGAEWRRADAACCLLDARRCGAAALKEKKKVEAVSAAKAIYVSLYIYLFTYLFIAPIGHRRADFAWVSSLMVRACLRLRRLIIC